LTINENNAQEKMASNCLQSPWLKRKENNAPVVCFTGFVKLQ